MDPQAQAIEQGLRELALVMALAQHKDPEGLFGLAKLDLGGEAFGAKYALQQNAWALAA